MPATMKAEDTPGAYTRGSSQPPTRPDRRLVPRPAPPERYLDHAGRQRLRGRRPSMQPQKGAKCPAGHFITDTSFMLDQHAYKCRHQVPVAGWTPPPTPRGAPVPAHPTRDCGILLYVLANIPATHLGEVVLWATEVTPDELAHLQRLPIRDRLLYLENEDPDTPV